MNHILYFDVKSIRGRLLQTATSNPLIGARLLLPQIVLGLLQTVLGVNTAAMKLTKVQIASLPLVPRAQPAVFMRVLDGVIGMLTVMW